MTTNVGGSDRVFRWFVALTALGVAIFAELSLGWRIAAIVIGTVALFTALTGYCPLNDWLGINTHQNKRGGRS
jgi:hypothetical protein